MIKMFKYLLGINIDSAKIVVDKITELEKIRNEITLLKIKRDEYINNSIRNPNHIKRKEFKMQTDSALDIYIMSTSSIKVSDPYNPINEFKHRRLVKIESEIDSLFKVYKTILDY